jgi:AraC family transcriptional regulator
MKQDFSLEQVRIVDFPDTRVALLSHRGDEASLDEAVRRLVAWRKENRLPPSVSATYNLLHGPIGTEPGHFHHDLCVATDREVVANPFGVVAGVIPGGRCAAVRHLGSDDHLEETLRFLCSEWLPQSGEEPRDFPLFLQRVRFFPEVAEPEAVTDVFLPIK